MVALTKSSTFIDYCAQYPASMPKRRRALLLVQTDPAPIKGLGSNQNRSALLLSLPENISAAKKKTRNGKKN
jgi:hypothetical protein